MQHNAGDGHLACNRHELMFYGFGDFAVLALWHDFVPITLSRTP